MTRSVSVAVMAHPARRDLVHNLLERLGEDVPVSWDPHAEPSRDKQRRWMVGAGAWTMHDQKADWHIVLQDDAKVCDQFIDVATNALRKINGVAAASWYYGDHPPFLDIESDVRLTSSRGSWVYSTKLHSGLGIVLPTGIIPDMLNSCYRMSMLTYDMRISQYLRKNKFSVGYWLPCLVDHLQVPSLLGHMAVRKAVSFIQDPTRAGLEFQAFPVTPTAPGMTPRAGGTT